MLGESGMPVAGRVLVLFLELFLEMCSLALVCLLLAWLFHGRGASVRGLLALVGGYSTAVLGAGAVGLLLARRNAHGPPPPWAGWLGLHAGRWRAVQRTLRQLRASVHSLRRSNLRYMLAAFACSVVHVVCKVAALPVLVFLGDRSFALTMDSLAPLVLWPLALFYGGVVVPAPGGGGFIEGAFAMLLKPSIPAGVFAASLIDLARLPRIRGGIRCSLATTRRAQAHCAGRDGLRHPAQSESFAHGGEIPAPGRVPLPCGLCGGDGVHVWCDGRTGPRAPFP